MIDISVVGFEVGELDLILGNAPAESDTLDHIPPEHTDVVTQPGDLWQLGDHRILCGDCRNEASFQTLLGERVADVVFIDPPFNVVIDGVRHGFRRDERRRV